MAELSTILQIAPARSSKETGNLLVWTECQAVLRRGCNGILQIA